MTAAESVTRGRELLVGERTVPELPHENYWFRRHEAAYLTLPALLGTGARVVVEAGCGEGYGASLLHRAGFGQVVGLDYDAVALSHATTAYPAAVAGRAARANLVHLPLADAVVDAVVSLQTVEHLWGPEQFLAECARVLRPGGRLVLTTPNRPTFSPGLGRGEKPPNPFHVREFDAAELRDTVAAHLTVTELRGVRHGSRIDAWEAAHGSLVAAQLATPAADWPPPLHAMVASVTAADFAIEPLGDDDPRLLDLVVVARREA